MQTPRPTRPLMQLASLKVAAWLLSLTLSFAAAAANEPPAEAARDGRAAISGHANRIDDLRQQLKLSADQDALFKSALEATEKLHREMRATMQEKHEQMQAQLAAKSPDLHAMAAAMDQEKAAHDAKRKEVRDAWLNFYDALNPEQKDLASKFLLAQINMMSSGFDHHHVDHRAGPAPHN